jgi:hypothetical protein
MGIKSPVGHFFSHCIILDIIHLCRPNIIGNSAHIWCCIPSCTSETRSFNGSHTLTLTRRKGVYQAGPDHLEVAGRSMAVTSHHVYLRAAHPPGLRVCLLESPGPAPSWHRGSTPREGMVVEDRSERLHTARRTQHRAAALERQPHCVTCERSGRTHGRTGLVSATA